MGIALVEPAIVAEVFVNGVIAENLGDGTMRFTGYSRQRSLTFDGVDYVVVNRVIMPVPAIMASIKETMQALNIQCCGGERMRVLAH
ncbi:MAG: hypothetical protein E5V64_06620 [Mesorhizobium sp.]|uniref:hypothetical protein n=1 Tax=Mesorhizobium sp. TaxID=1871066 RepID=UPI0011FBE85B|nr:hypothetical protein [Mesorhizobium sp.]TIV83833.1 MAG: hypothetical protein E5V64_06620 [Mesorhizobium sp.]